MNGYKVTSYSETETEKLGMQTGALLFPGAFVALYGDLGAGKTAFVRGVGAALGTTDINSPTFTIVQEYATHMPLYHFDAYRLQSATELYDMGFEEYLNGKGILLMEWPSHVMEALPSQRLDVTIEGCGDQERTLIFSPKGEAYCKCIAQLIGDCKKE